MKKTFNIPISKFSIDSLLYFIGSLFYSAISFLFIPLFIKNFSVEQYGIYSIITFCGSVASTIFYLGVTSALPRSYYEYETSYERKRCFSTTFILLIAGALILTINSHFYSSYLSSVLFASEMHERTLKISFLGAIFTFLNFSFLTYLRLEKKALQFVTYSIVNLILIIIGVYYFVVKNDEGVYGAVLGNTVAQSIMFIIFIILLGKKLLTINIIKNEILTQLKFGLFIVISSLAGMSILWIDQLFINKYLNLTDVGIYSLAAKLASVITIVFVTPFTQILNPLAMEKRKSLNIKNIIQTSIRIYFGLGLILCLILLYFFNEFLLIYDSNNQYLEALQYMPLLMLGVLLYGFNNVVGIGLFYSRRTDILSKVYIFLAVMNFLGNWLLIPTMGISGAILSSLITYILSPILIYLFSKNFFHVDIDFIGTIKIILVFFFLFFIYDYILKYYNVYIRLIFEILSSFLFAYYVLNYYLNFDMKMIKKSKGNEI